MRADRSEAGRLHRKFREPSACCEDRHGEEKGSRAGRGRGTRAGRRRQSPLCERGLSRAGGRPHRGQDRQGRRVRSALPAARRRRLSVDGTKEAEVIALFDKAMADDAEGSRRRSGCVQHGQQRRRRYPRDDGAAFRGFLAGRLLRRLPVRPRGGAPAGAARPRHGDLHRRLGLAARPAALRRLQCHQGRAAAAGPVAGARVRPAGHPYRPRHHRRRHRGRPAAVAHARPQGQGRRRRAFEHRGNRRQLLAPAHRQHRSAWTHEIDLRPYKEPF